MRALVVDDSVAMRSILRVILSESGFEVAEGANGAHALEVLEGVGPVELMLIDWNMPGISGLDLLRAIREDVRYRATKIMMVTTETDLTQVQEALRSGADEYMMKPFTREAAIEKLQLLGF